MNEQQAATLVAAFRKLLGKTIDLERRVADLEDEEREEDRWFAELSRELDGILPAETPTAILDSVQ